MMQPTTTTQRSCTKEFDLIVDNHSTGPSVSLLSTVVALVWAFHVWNAVFNQLHIFLFPL